MALRKSVRAGAPNLKDDERHHQAEPLLAAAEVSGDLGLLLHCVKFADSLASQAF